MYQRVSLGGWSLREHDNVRVAWPFFLEQVENQRNTLTRILRTHRDVRAHGRGSDAGPSRTLLLHCLMVGHGEEDFHTSQVFNRFSLLWTPFRGLNALSSVEK